MFQWIHEIQSWFSYKTAKKPDLNFLQNVEINNGYSYRYGNAYCAKGAYLASIGVRVFSAERENLFSEDWKSDSFSAVLRRFEKGNSQVWSMLTAAEVDLMRGSRDKELCRKKLIEIAGVASK